MITKFVEDRDLSHEEYSNNLSESKIADATPSSTSKQERSGLFSKVSHIWKNIMDFYRVYVKLHRNFDGADYPSSCSSSLDENRTAAGDVIGASTIKREEANLKDD